MIINNFYLSETVHAGYLNIFSFLAVIVLYMLWYTLHNNLTR